MEEGRPPGGCRVSDVVVTVPRDQWFNWLAEGDLPGQAWTGNEWAYGLGGRPPIIHPGERVYIVCRDRLRGYAPLVSIATRAYGYAFIRRDGAVAVTIDQRIPGFRGWRRRWWDRDEEKPFPGWREP